MEQKFSEIFVDRRGTNNNSFMKTTQLLSIIDSLKNVKVVDNKLINVSEPINYNNDNTIDKTIKYVKIKVKIIYNLSDEQINENNILGKNDYLISDEENIIIPENETTSQLLNFYGAKLINTNEIFNLNYRHHLPLFNMEIGNDYVSEYLLKENYGDGFYIETHDTPHYHQPSDENAKGYLILGKFEDGYLYLSKFNIPYSKAIFTPSHILHNDAYLIGNYNVIYTKTPNYSTYILKNPQNKIINVK